MALSSIDCLFALLIIYCLPISGHSFALIQCDVQSGLPAAYLTCSFAGEPYVVSFVPTSSVLRA